MTASTEPSEHFQIPLAAAEAYEADFVPALFAQWAPILCDAAEVQPGARVLDVACGTGVLARTAADRVGAANVVGVDVNEAMLIVARRLRGDIDWRLGDVSALPLPDDAFTTALCQMALMFFPDPRHAVSEMARVTAPGGTVAVLVPSSLDAQPAYGPFVEMVCRHAGAQARTLLNTYFAIGDAEQLTSVFEHAGVAITTTRTVLGAARFPSADALVATEVASTPLGERLSPAAYERIRVDAHTVLDPFTKADGTLAAPFECQIVVGRSPGREFV